MSPLKFLRNVIVALTGQTAPSELAGAVAMGMLIAFVPKANLIAQILFLLLILMKVNFALAAASTAVFLPLTPLTDRIADKIGYALLTQDGLQGLWTALYNQPIVPWTNFNNTLVIGNLVLGLLLYIPMYLLAKRGVAWYQATLSEKVLKWKIVKAVKASYIFRLLYPTEML